METLTPDEARCIALRAQGFGRRWSRRDPAAVLDHLGAIQLDSVSVVVRPQDLVSFSRMGSTPPAKLHQAIYEKRRGFEYWGHAASWLPMSEYRWFLPRMARMREAARPWWKGVREKHGSLYEGVLARVRDEGPLSVAAFEEKGPRRGTWWDWRPAKLVLEDLFDQGLLMTSNRTAGFARLYDLPQRVLPESVDLTNPGPIEASRYLMARGFRALGVATAQEAADYIRLRPADWRPALVHLVESGRVVPVAVAGWSGKLYADPAALERVGPVAHRPTFLSPFDNLVWNRARTERLFDFHYRIEIYVPEAKRKFGYYVLPLLVNGRIVGRADFKLDRTTSTLKVHGLWLEAPAVDLDDVARALRDLAQHLNAVSVQLAHAEPRGTLGRLRAALKTLW